MPQKVGRGQVIYFWILGSLVSQEWLKLETWNFVRISMTEDPNQQYAKVGHGGRGCKGATFNFWDPYIAQ